MKRVKLLIASFTLMFFFVGMGQSMAQLQTPVPSPAAFVSQNVGFTKISIDYSSPAVKGRKIFGEIEKFGTTWRAGANATTMIEFSTAVNVGGRNLRPGKYAIFMTPTESGDWTVRINSKGNSVFAYMKDGKIDEEALAKDDLVAFKASTTKLTSPQERLIYTISAEDNKVAKITMTWENYTVSFMVDTQVDQKMEGFKGAF
ncbi:DUF2911 domain-containing protein [Belliella pelovolcani]|uniref:DUF2911 domain-containing protein n=1 Tax=Belliella pelovolcani TaxID=529505 RepID=A0A1N7P296_9BACT|nr:DUF2911 domain-containing protein [Belliella pelovolcani]SIT04549.1 Protein of unknown function [Belliella pelovolcani]